jgi:hypothetical protein
VLDIRNSRRLVHDNILDTVKSSHDKLHRRYNEAGACGDDVDDVNMFTDLNNEMKSRISIQQEALYDIASSYRSITLRKILKATVSSCNGPLGLLSPQLHPSPQDQADTPASSGLVNSAQRLQSGQKGKENASPTAAVAQSHSKEAVCEGGGDVVDDDNRSDPEYIVLADAMIENFIMNQTKGKEEQLPRKPPPKTSKTSKTSKPSKTPR